MADALDECQKLIARATAAIAEAKRLVQENLGYQLQAEAKLKRMYFRASFHPKTVKLLSPLDFPAPRTGASTLPTIHGQD